MFSYTYILNYIGYILNIIYIYIYIYISFLTNMSAITLTNILTNTFINTLRPEWGCAEPAAAASCSIVFVKGFLKVFVKGDCKGFRNGVRKRCEHWGNL